MKNLLVLTLEFYDRHDVKRKDTEIKTVDVTFTHGADHWFWQAHKAIEDRYGFDNPGQVHVIHWSLTECGGSAYLADA